MQQPARPGDLLVEGGLQGKQFQGSYKSDIYGNANAYSTTLPPACLARLDWLFREPHQPRGPVGFSS